MTAAMVRRWFFPPVVEDAYTFGKIAAANALSDIYAMGGRCGQPEYRLLSRNGWIWIFSEIIRRRGKGAGTSILTTYENGSLVRET